MAFTPKGVKTGTGKVLTGRPDARIVLPMEDNETTECDPHNAICSDDTGECLTCAEYWLDFHAEGMREAVSLYGYAEPGSRVDQGLPAYNRESYFR